MPVETGMFSTWHFIFLQKNPHACWDDRCEHIGWPAIVKNVAEVYSDTTSATFQAATVSYNCLLTVLKANEKV